MMNKESDLYDPLNTKTLGGDLRLDVETYENVQDNIHVQGINRKLLELTDLIGRVTNNRSSSGPIPGTMKIVETEIAYSETGAATGYKTMFVPQSGEVWQFIAASSVFTGGSSGQSLLMGEGEPSDIVTPPSKYITVAQESSTGNPTWSPLIYGADLFFDENIIPILQVYSQTTGESSKFFGAFVRVR